MLYNSQAGLLSEQVEAVIIKFPRRIRQNI